MSAERLTRWDDEAECALLKDFELNEWKECINGFSADDVGQMMLESAIFKLAEYEDAEEQGRLVVYPCRIGDTAYYIGYGEVVEFEVMDFQYWISHGFGVIGCGDFENVSELFFTLSRFGEDVFLSYKDAEVALAGRQGEDE